VFLNDFSHRNKGSFERGIYPFEQGTPETTITGLKDDFQLISHNFSHLSPICSSPCSLRV